MSEESRIIQGTGQATFTENGTFESEGLSSVTNFYGTFTRTIGDGRTFVANGTWNGSGEIKASWIELPDDFNTACNVDTNDSTVITMPENETLCLKDDTGDLPIYLINGEVVANGRFTSDGITTLVQEHEGSSFDGIGDFEGTGTFNGTGLFIGIGEFSGEMVEPGSFYQTGLTPGEYDAYAVLENGIEVKLPETVIVSINPSFDLSLQIPGSLITGNVTDESGNPMDNVSFEWFESSLGEESLIHVTANEQGNYSYGPIYAGTYQYRIDVDNDGFYELDSTITFGDDSQTFTPISGIPVRYDATINLLSPTNEVGQDLVDLSNRNISFVPLNSFGDTVNSLSNEHGEVYVELSPGTYQVKDSNLEEYVLFTTIEINDQDTVIDALYSESVTLYGQILAFITEFDENWEEDDKLVNSTPASGVVVIASSGDLEFASETNLNGEFSIDLPGDRDYQVVATNTLNNYGIGFMQNFTTMEEIPENYSVGTKFLDELIFVKGNLYLFDTNNSYDASTFAGYIPTVQATDENLFVWESNSDVEGNFAFNIPAGNYSFSVEETILNVSVVDGFLVEDIILTTNEVNLTMAPEPLQTKFMVFLDSYGNMSFEDGTPIIAEFSIESLITGDVIEFSVDNYSQPGVIETTLPPGQYAVSVNYSSADQENASDFNNFFQTKTIFVDPFVEEVQNYSIGFANEYLFNGKLSYPDGENITTEFLLYNEQNDEWLSVITDSNGDFSSYIPSGDWLVVISPIEYENKSYTLRQPLIIGLDSSLRTDVSLILSEVVDIEFVLEELSSGLPVENARVIAVSQDGLGNVTLAPSNETGHVLDGIMPGKWHLSLEKFGVDRIWTIEENEANSFDTANSVDNKINLSTVSTNVSVRIGGRIYWDINGDNEAQITEWVEDVNLTITGINNSYFSEQLSTNVDGLWQLFVPASDSYNITVTKEGYSTEYISTENETQLLVGEESIIVDSTITADNVDVSGVVVTTLANPEDHLSGASITLYPASGTNYDPVIPSTSYTNGELSWSTSIKPGSWVVVVVSDNLDENGGGVAIDYLDANVAEGGELEMSMSTGGYLHLTSAWTDTNLLQHHVGESSSNDGYDMINQPVFVSIDIGLDTSWDYQFDEDGTLTVLLPVSNVEISSEFMTEQRDLEMEYTAFATGSIEQGIIDIALDYNRRVNSDASITIANESITNATYIQENFVTATISNENLDSIEFDLDIEYQGTEVADVFTLSGNVDNVIDSELWVVEIFNGSDWSQEAEFRLGIGETENDDSVDRSITKRVRILLPNISSSLSLDNGHKITFELNTDSGISNTTEISVKIPQIHGFQLSNIVAETGVSPGGRGEFSLTVTNTGNGDDSFVIELADNLEEGWQITPTMSTLTISKDDQRTQEFSIFAPESFTSGEIEATVTITSEDGVTTQAVTVTIKSSRISLSVDETLSQELTKVYESQPGQIVVPISNSGYRTATAVLVTVNLTNDLGNEVLENIGNQTIIVPAGQTINATFTLDQSSKKFNRYAISVDVLGEDNDFVEDSVEPFDYQEETILDTAEPTSGWFMVVIIVLTILVGYGGLKVARNKSSARF